MDTIAEQIAFLIFGIGIAVATFIVCAIRIRDLFGGDPSEKRRKVTTWEDLALDIKEPEYDEEIEKLYAHEQPYLESWWNQLEKFPKVRELLRNNTKVIDMLPEDWLDIEDERDMLKVIRTTMKHKKGREIRMAWKTDQERPDKTTKIPISQFEKVKWNNK